MPANIKPNKCSPLLSWDWLLPATEPGLHSAMFWAAVFGGIGLAAQVVAGCLNGWRTQTGQLFAFAAAFPAVVFAEFFRAMLCGALRQFGKWPVGCAVTFVLTAVECLPQLPGLPASSLAFCQDLLQIALPALATSAVLTALTMVGGVLPAWLYRLLALLPLLWPKVPAENRFTTVFLTLLLPLLYLIALDTDWSAEPATETGKDAPAHRQLVGMLGLGLPCALLIAFFAGLRPLFPTAIATGSMEPEISVGDMVVVADWQWDLAEGDVIAYAHDGKTIVHRITEVVQQPEGTAYITQGDANNAPDADPVQPSQIEGKVVARIPALGWVSLWFHGS